jgi:hypothetical protein
MQCIVSFLQLLLTTAAIFLSHEHHSKLNITDSTSVTKTKVKFAIHLRRNVLLWYTDFPVFLLYIIAFSWLSDYIIPTRILRGARDGTSCYMGNQFSTYLPVVTQSCIIGQYGYWFTMGAMYVPNSSPFHFGV